MDSKKCVFWVFIICAAVVHCFETDITYGKEDWKTTKNIICLKQHKGFGGKNVWESIKAGSYSPNTTVWLNGLVLRSPVMEFHGCYNIEFENGSEKLVEKNHFINCSKTCEKDLKSTDGSYITLKGNSCYCFKPMDSMKYVSNIKCSGSEYDNNNNTQRDLYNVYRFTDHKPNEIVGMNCFSKPKASQPTRSTNCSALLKFKCQGAVKYIADASPVYTECTKYLTYEDAYNNCQQKNMYIKSESGKCGNEEIWSSAHAEETVLWDQDADFDFDENMHQCLLAEYSTIYKNYTLKAKSCTEKYQGICLISKDPTTRPNTLMTSEYSSPSSVNDFFNRRDESNHKDNTGLIIGITFGIVLSLGLTIAGIICWRRRSRHTSVTRTTGSLYYSTVQSDELSDQQLTTPRDYNYTEQPPHLTNTEEGHYNHLGDDELQQNVSGGPVYDHSGMDTNLYDSSTTHGRQSGDLHGVYDCNQCTSEYMSMNDKKKLTSPDDTYDHT